jgi:hypothetical protein
VAFAATSSNVAEYVSPRVTVDVEKAKDIVIHPGYDSSQMYNNIALIKLPITMNIKTRNPIDLHYVFVEN